MVKGTCSDTMAKASAKVSTILQAASKDMQTVSQVFDDLLMKDKGKTTLSCTSSQKQIVALPPKEQKETQSSSRKQGGFKINVSFPKVFRVERVMQDKPRLLIVTLAAPRVKGDIP